MSHIYIDAGHGGSDDGCIGLDGTKEKDLNLAVANLVIQKLQTDVTGLTVDYTRTTDTNTPLMEIVNKINATHKTNPYSLIVDIHHNAKNPSDAVSPKGIEIYYSETSPRGLAAAETMEDELQVLNRVRLLTGTDIGRRLAWLYLTEPVAILIECGYLTDPNDLAMCKSPEFQDHLASNIVQGIMNILDEQQGV